MVDERTDMTRSDLLAELNALAQAVANDPSTRLRVGKPGSGWSACPDTSAINADLHRQFLEVNDLRALVVHEAGHILMSHYTRFLAPLAGTPACDTMRCLLNCLEDPRVELYVANYFPGTRPWLVGLNRRMKKPDECGWQYPGRFLELLAALSSRYTLGVEQELPGLSPPVAEALAAVDGDARAYIFGCQPRRADQADNSDVKRYLASPAAEYFKGVPPPMQAMCRLCSYEAFVIAQRIHDALRHLIDDDLAHNRPVAPPPPGSQDRDWDFAEALGLPRRPARRTPARPQPHLGALITELVAQLEQLLPPDDVLHWEGPFRAGDRLNLRRAMQAEADPAHAVLWQRRGRPTERTQPFYALIDLSGSMGNDGKIDNAMVGVRVFTEALAQLGFPCAVYGFQDELIPFLPLGQPLDAAARACLATMPLEVHGARAGGHNQPGENNDGPVLRNMVAQMTADGVRLDQAVLLVLSDGAPSGPGGGGEGARQLHEAVAWTRSQGVTLVSLGLGPGTSHVTHFYGASGRAEVPLQRIPAEVAAILRSRLMQLAAQRAV